MTKVVAVILASGTGERMKLGHPKQLLKVAGRSILEQTVRVFDASEFIDEIIVMMQQDFLKEAQNICQPYSKVTAVLAGGSTRNDTSRLAIESILDDNVNILFHDGVRPLVSDGIIKRCIDGLKDYRAVDVAIDTADTIIEVNGDVIKAIPNRDNLRRGQTPQGFWLPTIKRAYDIAKEDPDFKATDDCGVVLKYLPDVPIGVVSGSEENIKVTYPIDAYIADRLFQLSTVQFNLQDLGDSQLRQSVKGKTFVVFGGSYGIGGEIVRVLQSCDAKVVSFSRSNGVDVGNKDSVSHALAEAYIEMGKIDVVINCAGQLNISKLIDMDENEIRQAVDVNYLGSIFVAKEAHTYLKKTEGSLLFFTSSSYTRGRQNYGVYSSSKAAIVNLMQSLAEEWVHDGIRVNCINPERTATPMRSNAFGDEDPATLLDPAVVANASIVTAASGTTGQVVDVRVG